MIKKQIFTVKEAGYEIQAEVTLANKDLLVNLLGGDLSHLGGVLTYDVSSQEVKEVKLFSHDGRFHKDIFLAQVFFENIKDQLPGSITITAGVHVDGISQEQIAASKGMTEDLARQCSAWLKEQKGFKEPVYSSHFK